jgi:hypothetical protein
MQFLKKSNTTAVTHNFFFQFLELKFLKISKNPKLHLQL